MILRKFQKTSLVLACSAVVAVAPAFAQMKDPPGAATTPAKGDPADRAFIEKATAGGMLEVELGKIAQQKASNSEVKRFGQKMSGDHARANSELEKIAVNRGVPVPSALPDEKRADVDRLAGLSGEQFDREYMKFMVADHQQDVAEFRKASTTSGDPEVKRFAAKTLPVLEEHLKMAEKVNASLTRGGKSSGTSSDSPSGRSGASTSGDGVRVPGDPGMMPPEKMAPSKPVR